MVGVKGQVQKRGVERRRAMVDAAIRLFSQQGVRGTGVAAIAEQAGVTPSALIHHFGSKDGLVQAVLEEADRRALARLSATPDSEPTLAQAFDWFVRDAEHTAAAERELTALHTTLTAENLEPGTALHTWFRDRGRALRAHLTALFTRAAADGSTHPDLDPTLLATEVAAFLEGAHLLWLLDPDQVDLPAVHRGYFEGLASRLRP
ncbi:TetR/AcrR family transcriptional regulator [Streptomyces europaeiscabiei]|uniref:TetR/AcrR family transcriptional regulator n=1 Tax=Streptomyces europaeiscabiei TaxID=146819 RepID=A0ABU4NBC4_9ACTN|nr:TetR/AcrR family transcriptional regulator [Streptomyces europaeiscabiei]MDX2526793.1 TetR/AcrR family transcriptional regulator [Streptomyces europaeiscabiei]MDX2762307.1 TetR/AcrR family transcriptional regulator [Streptomyces europaeiscabiei]MDX2772024.1 TetR/AcrR family transcriptional regulator [Streptomyces europaeiscabiei]MDX3541451.1 TetR/AcrR family transcriptional regulator [Streptomyces europaeiscabiei]MDX3551792.1 TetR/AcrR family transcriptional regulator [Streptomyces europaei